MNFTTAVGQELAARLLGMAKAPGDGGESAELMRLLAAGVARGSDVLARSAAPRISRVFRDMDFQTDLLAIHSVLEQAEQAGSPRGC
jgi:hypothetical protein